VIQRNLVPPSSNLNLDDRGSTFLMIVDTSLLDHRVYVIMHKATIKIMSFYIKATIFASIFHVVWINFSYFTLTLKYLSQRLP
jgi:hypothetical protein